MAIALRVASVLLILGFMAWAGWVLHDAGHLSRAGLIALAEDRGAFAPVILVGAMILAVIVGPIPTVPISIASGLLFGPVAGFAYAWAGAMIGAGASFWLARLAGRPLIERLAGSHVAFCPYCSDRLLFWIVFGCRLLPVISFALVSYGAGLTAMTTRAFLIATGLGMIPMTALYIAVGTSLAIDPVWAAVGGAIAVAFVLAAPWLVERFNPFGLRDLLRRHGHGRGPESR